MGLNELVHAVLFLCFIVIIPRDVGEKLYLSPYIEAGDIATAQSLARVTEPLDGMEGNQPEAYSGFITVNDATYSHIFFWFFPAEV